MESIKQGVWLLLLGALLGTVTFVSMTFPASDVDAQTLQGQQAPTGAITTNDPWGPVLECVADNPALQSTGGIYGIPLDWQRNVVFITGRSDLAPPARDLSEAQQRSLADLIVSEYNPSVLPCGFAYGDRYLDVDGNLHWFLNPATPLVYELYIQGCARLIDDPTSCREIWQCPQALVVRYNDLLGVNPASQGCVKVAEVSGQTSPPPVSVTPVPVTVVTPTPAPTVAPVAPPVSVPPRVSFTDAPFEFGYGTHYADGVAFW